MAQPYFESNKNRMGGFEYPFYVGEVGERSGEYECPHHWHYHLELLYFAEGTAEVFAGNGTIRAEQGDLLFIPPCDVHAVKAVAGSPFNHYVIGLDPELLAPMPALFTSVKYVLPYASDAHLHYNSAELYNGGLADIGPKMRRLAFEYATKEPAFELAIMSDIYGLLVRLIRSAPSPATLIGRGTGKREEDKERMRLSEALAYIDAHSHEPVAASQMARICLMSYSHFAACFKRAMHTSFSSYLHIVRVRKAERLLLDPNRSITQIALETGFNDTSYFIKHFRRIRGTSPKQYRKTVLGMVW